jgi:hypothetical protein
MKLQLENSISSPQDLKGVILEVREYARWYRHNAIKKQVRAGHAAEQPELSPAAAALIRSWGTKDPLSSRSLDSLITTLEGYQASAHQLTITLAAPPTSGLKKTLVAWCRENVAPDVLVNFEFNATLLGGMVVRSGSRIFDWSFRRQILDAHANFPEVLRRV